MSTLHSPQRIAEVIAAHGVKSASVASVDFGLTQGSVLGIWRRAKAKGLLPSIPNGMEERRARLSGSGNGTVISEGGQALNVIDFSVLARMRNNGEQGLTALEIGKSMTHKNLCSGAAAFLKRARHNGFAIKTRWVGRIGKANQYRYVLVDAPEPAPAPVAAAEPTRVPTVRSAIRGTPGAPVSVAWVSFLDGVGASA